MKKWRIQTKSIVDLVPHPKNPRQFTEKGMKDLGRSIDAFGLAEPIVVNSDDTIIGGHARILVLKQKGETECDCYVPNKQLSEKEVEQLMIRLNANQAGVWNTERLANEWDLSELMDWGLDISGFGQPEATEDDFEIPETIQTDIVTGDLFQIGDHFLLCGDSTSETDVQKLMNGEKAILGFTSPPYWVGKEYETQKSISEIDLFIKKSCECFNLAVQKDESRIVINTSTGFTTSFDKKKKRQVLLLIDKWTNNFYELGWNLRHIRHWIKEGQLLSTSPKTDLIDQHCEFLGTFENENGKIKMFEDILQNDNEVFVEETFYNTAGTTRGQERTGKKWALRSYWNDIHGNANANNHCASFPVELVARHILLYTKKGESVYDPFVGSGTTLLAAHSLKRICYCLEICPQYCAISLQRVKKYDNTLQIKCLNRTFDIEKEIKNALEK